MHSFEFAHRAHRTHMYSYIFLPSEWKISPLDQFLRNAAVFWITTYWECFR